MRTTGMGTTILGAVLLALGMQAAHAEQVTVAITAEVTQVSDPNGVIADRIRVGDQVTGYYVYETSTPEGGVYASNPKVGYFPHYGAPYGLFLEVDGYRFESVPGVSGFSIVIENNYGVGDAFSVAASNPLMDITTGSPLNTLQLSLFDQSGTAVSTDALPFDAPELARWPTRQDVTISSGGKGSATFLIKSRVLSATRIP